MNDDADIHQRRQVVSRWLERLLSDGDVVAIYCPNMSPQPGGSFRCNAIGFFNDRTKATDAALALDLVHLADAVYVNLNSVNPALLARGANLVQDKQRATVTDSDIVCRRNILIDLDPKRPTQVSSTDREMEAAINRGEEVRAYLIGLGLPDAALAMTGNGAGLVAALDMPLSADTDKLIAALLAGLSTRFSDEVVEVDKTVSNRARWTKLIGTTARKGADSRNISGLEDRPHRVSRIVHLPDTREPWTIDHLNTAIAALKPVTADQARRFPFTLT